MPWDRALDMLCGPLDLDGLPDGVAALVARHAPTTAVMAPFWRGLLTAPST
ncbi:hypothetical protein Ari01nite_57140 [Paractinoplanes rishiriensis]|uniref:Uncharacterized protein n=1 Tax=Paractinoplanes rishiriensis TaxID=1050105 RepID=A0A919K2G8_9ACTN|nr:hypothetical protein Ari01nite_57140 [Actinoplanes rishiriensis]